MNFQDLILHAGPVMGYIIIFAIFFAECGLFFGFFFPGDTLLFGLGLATATGLLSLPVVLTVASVAAITGVLVGYAFGKRFGRSLFNKPDSLFFKHEYIQKAEEFYERYGKPTIILCRFVPVLRTFAPIVAGVGNMNYGVFAAYTVIGGVAWVTIMTMLGYYLGNLIPNIDKYVLPIIALAVIVPLAGSIVSSFVDARRRKK